MKENELRIGNWASQPQLPHIAKITAIDYRGDDYYCKFDGIHSGCWCSDIEPIPLTEELILKCGFVKVDGFYYTYNCSFTLNYDKFDDGSYNATSQCNNIARGIKHLHQLQNLYFVLTGKELNINL